MLPKAMISLNIQQKIVVIVKLKYVPLFMIQIYAAASKGQKQNKTGSGSISS